MSTAPFIFEALGAQGLILLWVRRDEKSVLLNQAPSSLLWTAAQNIWVQNHTETVTKAEARVILTDALEEHSGLTTQKEHPSPLEFPSAPPFQMPDPLSWLLVTVPNLQPLLCWRVPPASAKFMTPSVFEDHFLLHGATTALQNRSHMCYQTLMFLENLFPSLLPWQKFPHFKSPKDSRPSVASHTRTHNGSDSVCAMFRSAPYKHKAVPK